MWLRTGPPSTQQAGMNPAHTNSPEGRACTPPQIRGCRSRPKYQVDSRWEAGCFAGNNVLEDKVAAALSPQGTTGQRGTTSSIRDRTAHPAVHHRRLQQSRGREICQTEDVNLGGGGGAGSQGSRLLEIFRSGFKLKSNPATNVQPSTGWRRQSVFQRASRGEVDRIPCTVWCRIVMQERCVEKMNAAIFDLQRASAHRRAVVDKFGTDDHGIRAATDEQSASILRTAVTHSAFEELEVSAVQQNRSRDAVAHQRLSEHSEAAKNGQGPARIFAVECLDAAIRHPELAALYPQLAEEMHIREVQTNAGRERDDEGLTVVRGRGTHCRAVVSHHPHLRAR
eukprot:6310270-Prymnesium_polylepis.1